MVPICCETRRKSRGIGRRLLLVVPLVLLLGVLTFGFALYRNWAFGGRQPPAPSAPEAQRWKPPAAAPANPKQPKQPPKKTPEELAPVIIESIPEVPEQLQGPSPPIEEESTSGSKLH